MQPTSWIAATLALALCGCESAPGPAPTPRAPAPWPLATPASSPGDARTHHGAASELQLAIVHGRLTNARELGAWIADHAKPRTDALVAIAARIEHAPDVIAAAAMTGQLAAACSSCHQERRVAPSFAFDSVPAKADNLEDQMHRHEWAAIRLWEGVTGPADAAWEAGATALTATEIDVSATTHAKPNADVVGFAETMRTQATRALDTHDATARAALYGEMLQTCASCHAIVRPQAVARGR